MQPRRIFCRVLSAGSKTGYRPGSSVRETPDAALGRLVREGELGQGEAVVERLEDGLDAFADGDIGFELRLKVGGDEVRDQPQRLIGLGSAALLVELDEDHG